MNPFLKNIVLELVARNGSAISSFCFVLPSKRSCTFLLRHIEEQWNEHFGRNPVKEEYPEVMTIGDLIERITGASAGSRMELLFTMFDAWRSLPHTEHTDFERFRAWGETLVSDFNEVDMYDVDPQALFTNMADFNEIQTDYLTDEQRRVINRYFGVESPEKEVARFWKHFNSGGTAEKRFLSLWQRLYPLYTAFNALLKGQNLTYPGAAYQRACKLVEAKGEALFPYKKIVFAGFNALSRVERNLFKLIGSLKNEDGEPLTEYFWDAPGAALAKDSAVEAGHFLHVNAEDFPCSIPEMKNYDRGVTFPQRIEVTACPGNTAQAKVISRLIEEITSGEGAEYTDPARIAVVLPDEGLLFPIFHSLPASVAKGVNLTMGYPLRMTEVASFFTLLRLLQSRSRTSSGKGQFYHKDVEAILSHTAGRRLLGRTYCEHILGTILSKGRYFVSPEELLPPDAEGGANGALLWRVLPKNCGIDAACTYLSELLSTLLEIVSPQQEGEEAEASTLEGTLIQAYLDAIKELREAAAAHNIEMDRRSAFSMIDRLLASHTVNMQGEPLSGLQVMGMLETRALDFDYLIIPSMNERIFPRRLRKRTFIPDALRRGYGIATSRFQESIFAYYFYRLIARAKRVHLLYDASQRGVRSGDPSRYLLQLRYIFGDRCNLHWNSARFSITASPRPQMEVRKNEEIQKILNAYLDPASDKALSASALKEYISCPMKFYLTYICGKKMENEPSEFMDAITQGNILHESMEYLYNSLPAKGREVTVTKSIISSWLDGSRGPGKFANISELIQAKVNQHYTHEESLAPLKGDASIMAQVLELYVQWSLEADLALTPFSYLRSEAKYEHIHFPVNEHQSVNMTMIIDRLDRVKAPDGTDVVRISDYKTGNDNTDFKSVANLFDESGSHKAIFQLMLYASLLPLTMAAVNPGMPLALAIYKTRELKFNGYKTIVDNNGKPVWNHLPLKEEFETMLRGKLSELFSPDTPFTQSCSSQSCTYCHFKTLCNR